MHHRWSGGSDVLVMEGGRKCGDVEKEGEVGRMDVC